MKERKVMNKICSSILKTSKHIKFVSVVDGNCKLLVGRSRRSGNRRAHAYYYRLHRYIFYLEYLIFAIDNLKRRPKVAFNDRSSIYNSHTGLYFEISGSNSEAMVAVTALNKGHDKFLCIYFEPAVYYDVQSAYALKEFNNLLVKICYNVL